MTEQAVYNLSRKELVDILGAVRDIPRIYEQIAKIESHIERITIRQDEKIDKQGRRLDRIEDKFEDLYNRVDESPYVDTSEKKEEFNLTQDLVGIIVKGLTVMGTLGAIIYTLLK